jgi:sialate O-acetylesterase
VTRKHQPVLDWTPIAQVNGGSWSGALRNVPAGGPYLIEIRAAGRAPSTAVHNVLVGDLWVLAGQSNMQGVGDLIGMEMPHELVHNFDMADRWQVAEEPLHTLASATDRVHWPLNAAKQPEKLEGARLAKYLAERKKGASLGLPFAVEMVRRNGVPIGLLSCAHGGTSMDQWDPDLKSKGGDSLYGSMLRRVQAAGGKVKGVLWYQGESDANPKSAPAFQQKFERLVAAIRTDFGQPDIPFLYVQIGRHISDSNVAEWNAVQEAQRKAESSIPNSAMIAAVDTALDDGIHVGTQDQKRLGKRMANLATGATRRGPRPVSAQYANGTVRVVFSEVNASLRSAGRLSGFSVHSASGAALAAIYKARVDPDDRSAVLLSIAGKLPEGAVLRYGAGKDPYCNLRDDADMAAPVFGPMPIAQ